MLEEIHIEKIITPEKEDINLLLEILEFNNRMILFLNYR